MTQTSIPFADSHDGLCTSPKLNALSGSGRPHVRIGVVAGRVMQRVDITIDDMVALIALDAEKTVAVRQELLEAVQRALPGRRW